MHPIRCVAAAMLMLCAGGALAQARATGQGTDASDLERAQRLAANPLKLILEAGRAPAARATGIARLRAEPAPALVTGPRLEALPSPAVLAAVLPLEALRSLPWPAAVALGGEAGGRPPATQAPNPPQDPNDPLAPPVWRPEPARSAPTPVRLAEAER